MSNGKVGAGRHLRIAAPAQTTRTRLSSKHGVSSRTADAGDDQSSTDTTVKPGVRKSSRKVHAAKAAPDAEKSGSGKSRSKSATKPEVEAGAKTAAHKKSHSRKHRSK